MEPPPPRLRRPLGYVLLVIELLGEKVGERHLVAFACLFHLDNGGAGVEVIHKRLDVGGNQCIRGTGNLIRFKPSYDYRGWSSGRLSMIIFSRNAFHTPSRVQYYSRKIQVHSHMELICNYVSL